MPNYDPDRDNLYNWKYEVEHRGGGTNALAGYGAPQCSPARIPHPWGYVDTVLAGSKPEHGSGGWEVLCAPDTQYTIEALGTSFSLKTAPGLNVVHFYIGDEPPPPEPSPIDDETIRTILDQLDLMESATRDISLSIGRIRSLLEPSLIQQAKRRLLDACRSAFAKRR